METPRLTSADYWESEAIDIRLNPKRNVDAAGLSDFLKTECGLHSAVVLTTSGSSGKSKFVILKKSALLSSARAVNQYCDLTNEDRWLGGLSTFHVGGLGIHARAYCNGATVISMRWDAWTRDGSVLIEAIKRSAATVTSLTPVHLCDLVRSNIQCPDSLRGVFLGGARIDSGLVVQARALGWPIWATYGMSETASQIATSRDGAVDWLPILPIWECRTDPDKRLQIRGNALFSGYAMRAESGWEFTPASDESGWFTTGDRCELDGRKLRFLGRADDAVKVSGELVSLSGLNDRLAACGCLGAVVAVPDLRRESELVLVLENGRENEGENGRDDCLERFNKGLAPIEQINRIVRLEQLPRTAVGKLDMGKMTDLARLPHFSHPTD